MTSRKSDCLILTLVVVCSLVFLFAGLGSYSLKEPDEGRYAEIPREMVESGDYVVPHVNYVRYFEKPPFLYWATAVSFHLFGSNEWGFRLPNALAAFLLVLTVFWFGRLWFGSKTGLLSSVVLLTSLGFFAMARIVTTDMFFAFFLTASLFSFLEYYRREKWLYVHLFYAFAALATLTKGPVAVLLLAATVIIFLLSDWNLGFLRKMRWLTGSLLYCVIALPWFIAISYAEPRFFHFFFIDQHLLRFFTTKHKRSGPLYYFIPVLAAGLFPWSFLLPRAIHRLWYTKEIRFLFLWSLLVFLFFSLSGSKLPPYVLPIFPSLSIIIAHFLDRSWGEGVRMKPEIIVSSITFFLFMAGSFAILDHRVVEALTEVTGPTEIMPLLPALKGFFFFVSGVSLAALAANIFIRKSGRSVFFLNAVFSFLLCAAVLLQIPAIDSLATTKPLAYEIGKREGTYDLLINVSALDHTLPFYTRKRVTLASYTGELEMGSVYDDAKPYFITADEFFELFPSQKRILAVTKKKKIPLLEERFPGKTRVLLCAQQRCLISNYPE